MKPWLDPREAANGLPVHENFKAWFRGSRVVDAEGDPLPMFHGTLRDFDAFDTRPSFGAHFTATAEVADQFTSATAGMVYPVHLRICNPVRMPDFGAWDVFEVMEVARRAGALTRDQHKTLHRSVYDCTYEDEHVQRAMALNGFDGIVYDNIGEGGGDAWIAFRPQQIKGLFNSGLYLQNSPSMTDHHADLMARAAVRARGNLAILDSARPLRTP